MCVCIMVAPCYFMSQERKWHTPGVPYTQLAGVCSIRGRTLVALQTAACQPNERGGLAERVRNGLVVEAPVVLSD